MVLWIGAGRQVPTSRIFGQNQKSARKEGLQGRIARPCTKYTEGWDSQSARRGAARETYRRSFHNASDSASLALAQPENGLMKTVGRDMAGVVFFFW